MMYSYNSTSRQSGATAAELRCSSCGAPVPAEEVGTECQIFCYRCDRSVSRSASEFDEDIEQTCWELDDFKDSGFL